MNIECCACCVCRRSIT